MAPKRKAGRPAKSPSAKKAKIDPITEKVNLVVEMLEAEDITVPSEACREALVAAMPHAVGLGAASDERHSYQTSIANIVERIFRDTEAKRKQVAADAKDAFEIVKGSMTTKEATLASVQARLGAAHEGVEAAKSQKAASESANAEAHQALEDANEEVDGFDGEQMMKQQERDSYNTLLTETWNVLKAGDFASPAERAKFEKKKVGPLNRMLKKLKMDESLLSAMGPALAKKADERGSFDEMALSQSEAALTGHIASLDSDLANGEANKAGKIAAQATAQANVEATGASLTGSGEALKEAKDLVVQLKKEESAAKKDIEDHEQAVSDADVHAFGEQASVDHIHEVQEQLVVLRDRLAATPEPEEPAADEVPPTIPDHQESLVY